MTTSPLPAPILLCLGLWALGPVALGMPTAAAIPETPTAPEGFPEAEPSPRPQPRDWWGVPSPRGPDRPFLLEQWGERDRQEQQYQNLQESLQRQQQQDRDRYEQRQRDWQLQQQRDLNPGQPWLP